MDRRTFAGKAFGVMGSALLAPLAARAETQGDAKSQESAAKKMQENQAKGGNKSAEETQKLPLAGKSAEQDAKGSGKSQEESAKARGGDKAMEQSRKAPGGSEAQESAAKAPGSDKSHEDNKKSPTGPQINSLPAKSGRYAPDEAERKRQLALQHLAARRLG